MFQEYFRLRTQAVEQLKLTDEHPYPHKFHVSTSLEEFIEKYHGLQDGQIVSDTELSVAGIVFNRLK